MSLHVTLLTVFKKAGPRRLHRTYLLEIFNHGFQVEKFLSQVLNNFKRNIIVN